MWMVQMNDNTSLFFLGAFVLFLKASENPKFWFIYTLHALRVNEKIDSTLPSGKKLAAKLVDNPPPLRSQRIAYDQPVKFPPVYKVCLVTGRWIFM